MLRDHVRSLSLLSVSLGFLFLFVALFRPASRNALRPFDNTTTKTKNFHFLVPTTNTNQEVCKLIASSSILGYPAPSLVGWEGRGRWNGTESHLFKLSETVFYLNTLRKEQDDDLVLILDAFDIWLQLPPEVLIRRYFRAIEKENELLRRDGILDKTSPDGSPVRNTVLFGVDKFCWPQNEDVIPCWAAPNSSLAHDIFGPGTDKEEVKLRPRFLNSGTIMGPVKDIRSLFKATIDQIPLEWDDDFIHKTSDQHYLSILWGDQEEARMAIRNGTADRLEDQMRTEYHIALDHESDAFQVNNWYSQYVTWMSFNRSSNASLARHTTFSPGRLDRLALPEDVASLPGPYSADSETSLLPATLSWSDVMLGTNTATGAIFPLYHITGDKLMRGRWWPRMWFHPHGEALLKAARKRWLDGVRTAGHHVAAEIDNVKYIAVPPNNGDVFQSMRSRDKSNVKGGAWNDLGEYMSWNEICGREEEKVFVTRKVPL
ncbi:hypothetical protein DOTSEDRAFT_75477 [Dothistroma septosporum NZE10]|uniref:Uncharacterized protein n=1 Tax=Dothistroma septosporum (strain NZE10 / CBS 128990) TaxID=675120 RepID=M2XGZ0_DOTSN|nr:hypothetical protein DOTSEDRAFT_75477 [Dothistroma septosporum NZE10]